MSNRRILGVATFAAGCFWGVEARFQQVRGVLDTTVGYAGGTTARPTYREVCSGSTGHAEAVEVLFDPERISYRALLEHFWEIHDASRARGKAQYRSAIFTHSPEQEQIARSARQELQCRLGRTLVTQIEPVTHFYRAEDYHQRYLEKRGRAA